jgi:hypothetical protein
MGWMTRVQLLVRAGIFLFATMSRLTLGPTHPPIQWLLGAFFPRVKQPGHKADHSPLSGIRVANAWSYTSTPPMLLHGMVFKHMIHLHDVVKQRDNFTLLYNCYKRNSHVIIYILDP